MSICRRAETCMLASKCYHAKTHRRKNTCGDLLVLDCPAKSQFARCVSRLAAKSYQDLPQDRYVGVVEQVSALAEKAKQLTEILHDFFEVYATNRDIFPDEFSEFVTKWSERFRKAQGIVF